jgi:hypothetical protein
LRERVVISNDQRRQLATIADTGDVGGERFSLTLRNPGGWMFDKEQPRRKGERARQVCPEPCV